MKLTFAALLMVALSPLANAQTSVSAYTPLAVTGKRLAIAEIRNVKLLDAKVVIQTNPNFEDRFIDVTIGLDAIASLCEDMKDVEIVSAQASLDSALNPSDFALQVNTTPIPSCATGSYGPMKSVSFTRRIYVDQRRITEAGKPWPKPNFFANSNIQHLSFRLGMSAGYHQWALYKLDISDLDNVQFTYKKTYSYVQGEVR